MPANGSGARTETVRLAHDSQRIRAPLSAMIGALRNQFRRSAMLRPEQSEVALVEGEDAGDVQSLGNGSDDRIDEIDALHRHRDQPVYPANFGCRCHIPPPQRRMHIV